MTIRELDSLTNATLLQRLVAMDYSKLTELEMTLLGDSIEHRIEALDGMFQCPAVNIPREPVSLANSMRNAKHGPGNLETLACAVGMSRRRIQTYMRELGYGSMRERRMVV